MTNHLVGVNALNPGSYFDTVFPYLNLLKGAASNTFWEPWFTSTSGTLDTGEEQYLQLDSDLNVTSLVASPTPPGGQVFTEVQTFICRINSLATGATFLYPAGPYTLKLSGPGTFQLVGDVNTIATSDPNLSVVGSTITSTLGQTQVGTLTFATTQVALGGIHIIITALPSGPTSYLKFLSLVPTVYQSLYDAGQITNPLFKQMVLGNGWSGYNGPIRFMQAQVTTDQDWLATFTATLGSGATSGTLSTIRSTDKVATSTWILPPGTWQFVFATGQIIPVTATIASPSLTWSTPLSGAITTSAIGGMAVMARMGSWSNRPLLSNFSWSTDLGLPLEAAIQICNELGLPPWLNVPGTTMLTDSTWATKLAQLMFNGTGAVLTGSNLSTFTGVSGTLLARVEYSNETWNGVYKSSNLCQMMGVVAGFYAAQGNLAPQGGQEWYGTQIAGICDAFSSVYGGAFSSRVRVVCMDQFAPGQGTNFLALAMNTPDWTSRAYTHGTGAIGCAPYFGTDSINATDAAAILATANPVNTMYSMAWQANATYPSVPTGGWVGNYISSLQTWIADTGGQPWSSLPIEGYEGGSALDDAHNIEATVPGWRVNVLVATQNDPRFAQIHYDPTHTLSTFDGYLEEVRKAGMSLLCQLGAVSAELTSSSVPGSASWGAIQSTMQVGSSLTALPSKYQGIMNFIKGTPVSILLVQKANNTATATSVAVTLNGVASGNTLIIGIVGNSGALTPTSITDSNGTVSTAVAFATTSSRAGIGIFYVQNAAAGTHLITSNWASSNASSVYVAEYSGISTTTPFDVGSAIAFAASATIATASIVPAQNGELIYFLVGQQGLGETYSAFLNALTQEDSHSASAPSGAWADLIQTNAASINGGATSSSTAGSGAAVAAFIPASSPPVGSLLPDGGFMINIGSLTTWQ